MEKKSKKKGDRGLYQRGKIWYIRFADSNGEIQRESSGSTNKTVAKQLLAVRKAEVAQGKFKKVQKQEKVLFKDYAQEFLRWAKVNKKYKSYLRYLTSIKQLIPFFGNRYMCDLKRKDIENYKAKRKEKVSAATINRDLACMKKMYNNAIADELVEINPVVKIEFFKEPARSPNFLSEEQAGCLLTACDNNASKTFVVLGLNTGMRLNEMLSLKWEQINFKDEMITLRDTKNNKEDSIPMNEMVLEQLQSLEQKSEYVICKKDGTRYIDFRKQWIKLIKKANLVNITPHVLRHTWATALVRAKVDLMTIMELGRWSDLRLVNRYSHIDGDHRTREIKKLDGKFKSDTKSDTNQENDNTGNV